VWIQWHRLFVEALGRADVVVVARVAASYLGRTPNSSELSAVRRAANSYARTSNAQVLHVAGVTATGATRRVLLLARADTDLEQTEWLHAIASGRIDTPVRRKPGKGGPQVTDSLVGRVARAARQAQMADARQLDPEHARALAQDLTEALGALQRLRDRLQQQGRSADKHHASRKKPFSAIFVPAVRTAVRMADRTPA
jgi:hypothetical protein